MAKVKPIYDDNNPLHPMEKLISQCRRQLDEIISDIKDVDKSDNTILIDGIKTEKKLSNLLSKSMKIYNVTRHEKLQALKFQETKDR
jgi:hypothetical protein